MDKYYRCCSSAHFVENVSVPLLCISALDDPLCTSEAIPWDECRYSQFVPTLIYFKCSVPSNNIFLMPEVTKILSWLQLFMGDTWHFFKGLLQTNCGNSSSFILYNFLSPLFLQDMVCSLDFKKKFSLFRWVGAVDEFLRVLHASPHMHGKRKVH